MARCNWLQGIDFRVQDVKHALHTYNEEFKSVGKVL